MVETAISAHLTFSPRILCPAAEQRFLDSMKMTGGTILVNGILFKIIGKPVGLVLQRTRLTDGTTLEAGDLIRPLNEFHGSTTEGDIVSAIKEGRQKVKLPNSEWGRIRRLTMKNLPVDRRQGIESFLNAARKHASGIPEFGDKYYIGGMLRRDYAILERFRDN